MAVVRLKTVSQAKTRPGITRIGKFAREEDGAIFIFSLQIFLILMIVGGLAIDFIRQEERRTLIQGTIDRAALAAASLSQRVDPKYVVNDYLNKAGLDYLDVDPIIETNEKNSPSDEEKYRRVTIVTRDDMPTIFGDLLGVHSLATNVGARAEESIGNVEISMVLDISGSMNDRDQNSTSGESKIASLRTAATNFVNTMFDDVQPPGAPAGLLSISIVPYNQQVSMGTTLASIYNLSTDHTKNTCADVQTLGFDNLAISPTAPLQRTMYGWSYDMVNQGYSIFKTLSESAENCYEFSYSPIMAIEDNQQDLLNKISSLRAGGDTAIDIGARWGFALLDPSSEPVAQALASRGMISSSVQNRPMPYSDTATSVDERSMKVMILMTDGMNTRSFSTKMEYRTGPSGFFSTDSATAFYDYDQSQLYWYSAQRDAAGLKPIYRFRDGTWRDRVDAGDKVMVSISGKLRTLHSISWETIWGKGWTVQYVIDKFLLRPRQADDPRQSVKSIYAEMAISSMFEQKDANLEEVCNVARSRGIDVYTIAVSAPPEGKAALEKCATGPSYAHEIKGDDLNDAFASIAAQIISLRLTN